MLKKLLLLIFIPFLLCGCEKRQYEEITFATWGSITEEKILSNIIRNFEKENPSIKINFMHIPQNYFQKIHLLFASNTAPDIIFINNLYLPQYAPYLEDLSSIINKKEFYPAAIKGMSVNGKIYAIPRDLSYFVFYVNLDKVKLPDDNWKIEDLLTIQKKSYNKCFLLSCEDTIYYAYPYLTYFGGGILDKSNNLIIDTDESKTGINFYKNIKHKYKLCPTKAQTGSLTTAQMFLNGQIGMYLSGRWMFPKISEKAKFSWAVINFPYGKSSMVCDTSGWAITKQSKHKNSALKFIKYISNEENSKYFAQTGLIVPANIKASELLNKTMHNEKKFLETISHLETRTVNREYKKLTDNINLKLDF